MKKKLYDWELINLFTSSYEKIKEKYYNELLRLCEEKTKLDFGNGFIHQLFVTDYDILKLEQFIHRNKLFDTNKVFKKYRDEILKEMKEIKDMIK